MRLLFGLVALLLAAATAGAAWQFMRSRQEVAAVSAPGLLVDVGGHRLHVWCRGSGSPAVVLESGLAGSAFEWGYVQPAAAQRRRVCAYDRAGLGYSEFGPTPRTSKRIAIELATLLDRIDMTEPIVLVGHSFGGFNVRLFTAEYPARVAGLVLVDASHEDQRRRYAEAGVSSGDLPTVVPYLLPVAAALGMTRAAGFGMGISLPAIAPDVRPFANATRLRTSGARAAAAEYLALDESAAQLRMSRRTLDVPLIVLSRTRERDAASGAAHDAMQADQATISTRACRVRVANSGHLIPSEQPAAVVAAIDEVVDAAQEGRSPRCATGGAVRIGPEEPLGGSTGDRRPG